MDREIKFKYIVKRGNGHIFSETFTMKQIENGEALKFLDINYAREKDVIKCQYTGLKDKNGKEIYEGDVFKTQVCLSPDGISSAHNIYYWVPVECEIVFNGGRFVGKWKIENHFEGNYMFSKRSGYEGLNAKQ